MDRAVVAIATTKNIAMPANLEIDFVFMQSVVYIKN
jgi:hypothetical protein